MNLRSKHFTVILAALALSFFSAPIANAQVITSYEMIGQPGNQASTAPNSNASGSSAFSLTRGAGLTAVAGVDSINSSAWSTDPTDHYVMGFDVVSGSVALVNSLLFGGRSSNTGPGSINVSYSIDGGAETLLFNYAQVGTAFSYVSATFPNLVVNNSFRVFFRAANTTSADGGTIGGSGTFRLGDYSPDGGTSFTPLTIGGAVVPEPSPMLLGSALGLVVFVAARVRRRPA